MIQTEHFFEEQYIVHQFIKVIRSKRYLFSKNPDDIRGSKLPTLDELSQKVTENVLEISREKREKFDKRGKRRKG